MFLRAQLYRNGFLKRNINPIERMEIWGERDFERFDIEWDSDVLAMLQQPYEAKQHESISVALK